MNDKEIKLLARLEKIEWFYDFARLPGTFQWKGFEVQGTCSLTKKYVIRYVDGKHNVFEWKNSRWVPLREGVYQEYLAKSISKDKYSNDKQK